MTDPQLIIACSIALLIAALLVATLRPLLVRKTWFVVVRPRKSRQRATGYPIHRTDVYQDADAAADAFERLPPGARLEMWQRRWGAERCAAAWHRGAWKRGEEVHA